MSDPCFEESYGVLQGSVLGPLFFLLYINDIQNIISSYFHLYSDDTIIIESATCSEQVKKVLETQLNIVDKWLNLNKLTINTSKTKVMLITTHQKRTLNVTEMNLNLNGENLSMISKDKVLGTFIDNNLTWKNHIDHICRKITSNIWLLSRIKLFLSLDHRIQFYKAYIQPHLDYCNVIWGGTCQKNLNRIF